MPAVGAENTGPVDVASTDATAAAGRAEVGAPVAEAAGRSDAGRAGACDGPAGVGRADGAGTAVADWLAAAGLSACGERA